MTPQTIYSALAEVATTAYLAFPEGQAADPPFIVYSFSGSDDLYADNTNYSRIEALTIELYTDNKDFAKEAALESALNGLGLAFSRAEAWIESERLYEVTYTTEVLLEPPTTED